MKRTFGHTYQCGRSDRLIACARQLANSRAGHAALFVIAEKDARVNNETNAIAASKLLKGPTDVARAPGANHAQIDSGTAFETAAKAAVEWFLKHL